MLATLAYLAESGMRPTVTSLQVRPRVLHRSGNVSHHSSGNAIDIAEINGIPIVGHQEPGGITEQAVRRLMQPPGHDARPTRSSPCSTSGANTVAMADHNDHIHVGFQPPLRRQPQARRSRPRPC